MKLLNKIKKIKKINSDSWSISIEFADGYKGIVDLSGLFSNRKPSPLISEIMRGNLFNKCFIESGHLAWPNGLELCADSLKMNAVEYAKKRAA